MKVDKLMRLEENLKILKEMKATFTIENLLSNKNDEWALRYGFFESLQIIIDLACHIVTDKNLASPKTYNECIRVLVQNNYIEKSLGDRLTKIFGLRNLMIHEYGIVEVEKLFLYLNQLHDIDDFIKVYKEIM
ncbi:MAG: DUF86 domain-containing protein [Ignavibacteriaceae bacterium]|jgi:uncharacterized protein YutE (UPF0331/DUF86 family)|nr:DUF86 domain-containing protein [Ignavibacteriaceae bacterium]